MTIKELRILRENLPYGFAFTIQQSLKEKDKEFSLIYIYQVLSGYRSNDDILDEAILLAKKTSLKKEEQSQAVGTL